MSAPRPAKVAPALLPFLDDVAQIIANDVLREIAQATRAREILQRDGMPTDGVDNHIRNLRARATR